MSSHPEELKSILEQIQKTFQISFEPLIVDGTSLSVLNIDNMPAHLDRLLATGSIQQPLRDLPLWAKAWPAAMILGRFLRKFDLAGKSVLDLGCGMGILSLIAAQYNPAQITAADIEPQALDFAKANILTNLLQDRVSTRLLDIRSPNLPSGQKFDIIAASEILYLDDLHRPLVKFMRRHLDSAGTAFFCTDISRLKPRFQELASKDFDIRESKIGIKSSNGADKPERRIYNILILEHK